jgi:PAS domain S-box-containing protein
MDSIRSDASLATEEWLQRTYRLTRSAPWTLHPTTQTMEWSPELFSILGIAEEGSPSLERLQQLTHPHFRKRLQQQLTQAQATMTLQQCDVQMLHPERDVCWLRLYADPVVGEDGEVHLVKGIAQDVTSQLEARHSHQKLHQRLQAAIEKAYHGVLLLNADGVVTYANEAAETLLERQSLEGVLIFELLEDAHRNDAKRKMMQLMRHNFERLQQERIYLNSEGEPIALRESVTASFDEDGELSAVVVQLEDLRELKQAQQAVLHTAKLASIGEVSASLAHEMKSPLSALRLKIEMQLQMLEIQTLQPEQLKRKLNDMMRIVDKSMTLLQQIRNFSRNEAGAPKQECHLHEILQSTLLMVQHTLKQSNVKLQTEIDEALPPLLGQPGQLEQVFTNLINNARDAMEGAPKRQLTIRTWQEGNSLCASVQDTGSGMPPAVKKRIFDSFFTTKERGKGTGLGMSIVRRIVEEHNGRIDLESEEGCGTTFTVSLPMVK